MPSRERSHLMSTQNLSSSIGNRFLKKVSGFDELFIDSVDGTLTFANAMCTFKEGICPGYYKEEYCKPDKATGKMPFEVFQLVSHATTEQMFSFVQGDLSKLALTQHQIINICDKYPFVLCPEKFKGYIGHSTLFLSCNDNDEFYIAQISSYPPELYSNWLSFDNKNRWNARYIAYVVIPVV